MSIELLERVHRAVAQIPDETRLTRQLHDLIQREKQHRDGNPFYKVGDEVFVRRRSNVTRQVRIDEGRIAHVDVHLDRTITYDVEVTKSWKDEPSKRLATILNLSRRCLILKEHVT